MPEVATAWVSVLPSAKGFKAALEKEIGDTVGDTGTASGRSFGNSFTSAIGGVAKAAVKVGAAIGAGMAGVGGYGLKLAAESEQAQIGFETLLGSAENAKSFIGDLQKFAAETPFDFPGLQSAASRLLAVGTKTADVIPLMTALGDATSGMGTGAEGIDRAVTALTQMQQKGKVTGEEMLQLAEAGIPAWDALATKLGVDVPKAQEMVSKGQVKVNDLMGAISEKAGPAFQRLDGMMAKQSQSLTGLVDSLKDSLGQGLAAAMGPTVATITQMMPALTDTLTQGLGAAAPALNSVFGALGTTVQALLPVLVPVINAVGGVAATLVNQLAPVVQALTPFVVQFAEILGQGLQQVLEALIPPLGNLLVAFAPLLPMIAQLIADIAGALSPVLATLVQALVPVIEALVTGLQPVIESIKPMLPDITKAMVAIASSIAQILIALTPLLPTIGKLIAKSAELTAKLDVAIFTAIATALEKLTPLLLKLVDPLVSVLTWVLDLGPRFSEMWAVLQPIFESGTAWIAEKIIPALQTLWSVAQTVWSAISTAISWAWENVIKPVWDAIKWAIDNVLTPLFHSFLVTISDAWDAISTAISWAWENVIKPVWDAIKWAIDNILTPLFNGLRDTIKTVWDAISGAISWAWDNVIKPIFDGIKTAVDTVISVFDTLTAPLKAVFNAIADAWNNTVGSLSVHTPDLPGTDWGGLDFEMPKIPKLHSGGIFNSGRGEGLALLRDGEIVLTPQQISAWAPQTTSAATTTNAGDSYVINLTGAGATPDDVVWALRKRALEARR